MSRSSRARGHGPSFPDVREGDEAPAETPRGPLSGTQSTLRSAPRGRSIGLIAVIAAALAGAVAVAATATHADPIDPTAPGGASAVAAGPSPNPHASASASASAADPGRVTGSGVAPVTSAAPVTGAAPASGTAGPPSGPRSSAARSTQPITVPDRGPGTFRRAKLDLAPPKGSGRVIRFDVRVEHGLRIDPDAVAREIHRTLSDRRSWRGTDRVRFRLVSDPSRARLHAYVATPHTTDRLCYPWMTRGAVSCQTGNRVVLNARRWAFGAKAYAADLAGYRTYLVNHEFGHALGYNHVGCPGRGRKAPVMMQQTKGLSGCRPNPWPAGAR